MELTASPLAIQDKYVPWTIIAQYFDASSIHELLLAMSRHRRAGYYDYAIRLSPKYIDWEDAEYARRFRTDVLEPIDPFGVLKLGRYRLNSLYDKIRSGTPLTENELDDVLDKLPIEMTERYLLFQVTDVDVDRIAEIVAPRPVEPDAEFVTVAYRGLESSGSVITFRGKKLVMPFQHRQVVRLLIERKGGLCTEDEFLDRYASIFEGDNYADPHRTLVQLMSAVRLKLKAAVGYNCIENTRGEGWSLNLTP